MHLDVADSSIQLRSVIVPVHVNVFFSMKCKWCMCACIGYTAEQAEIMFASVDKDGNGVIVEDEFIQWCQEELQRAADAAVEENEHFMSDSESDSDVDELVSKHAVMGAADEAAFAKRLGIDARQLSLGLYT